MEHFYDIIIEGQTVHKALSEDTFFEVMADLSTNWYEKGFPNPTNITHTVYTKETLDNVRKDSDQD